MGVSNELIKVLFGNQRQSMTLNTSLANVMQKYIMHKELTGTQSEIDSQIQSALQEKVNQIASDDLGYLDEMFVRMFFRADLVDEIRGSHKRYVVKSLRLDTGRTLFDLMEAGSSRPMDSGASELAQRIINASAPSMLAGLPDDEVLAALLLSEAYWEAMHWR